MSATYSNGTITQTGTDTDPTVFSGLTGVTITGTQEYRVVLFDNTKLIINGTLSLPKYYRLYFVNTSTVDLQINGSVYVDYFTTTATGTVYHTTPWVEFGRQSTNSVNKPCLEVSGTGSLYWRGGSILADPTIHLQSGATILFNNSVIESTNTNMFRINTTNLTFEGPLTNIGKRTTINTSGITLDNYSPKAGGGLDHGKPNTGFTLNNFSPEANIKDIALRYNNGNSVFNASTGMSLQVLPFRETGIHSHNGGGCRLYRKVSTNIKDISNNSLQSAKTFLPSYDDSNRINLTSNFGSGWDFTAVSNTTLTTAANGKSPTHNQILKVWYLLTTDSNDFEVIRFDKNANDGGIFTAYSYKYGYLIQSNDYNLNGLGDLELAISLLPNANITESNKATVDAYTEIDTAIKFYDRASSHLEDNLGTYLDFILTRSGNQIDAGSYNVTIDATALIAFDLTGNLITIKASTFTGDMITTGLITLANGAIFNGTRTDANGTIEPDQPISITNILAGSRLRIYNITTGVETVNAVVAGTSYTSSYQEGTGYNDGDTVRVYLTKLGKEEWVGDVIDTSNGFNVLASQVDDDVYTALGVDGTTVTKFQADYVNNEVDLVIGSDWTMAELYAWWSNNLTTEDGIRNFFGGITAIDQANFRINTSIVDLYLDNTTNASYKQTDNRRFFRDTGTGYPVRNPTTSGYGLDVVWRNTILIAETEAGGTSDLNFYDVKRAVKQVITNPKYIKGQK